MWPFIQIQTDPFLLKKVNMAYNKTNFGPRDIILNHQIQQQILVTSIYTAYIY